MTIELLLSIALFLIFLSFAWKFYKTNKPLEIERYTKEKPWRKLMNIEIMYQDAMRNKNAVIPDFGKDGIELGFWQPREPKDKREKIMTCLYWNGAVSPNGNIRIAEFFDAEFANKVKSDKEKRKGRNLRAVMKNHRDPSLGYVEVLMWWEQDLA